MSPNPPPRVTIKDVAREAGVSPTTVSHALNARGQVDAETRARVEKAALTLGYRPNRNAQRLRTGEAHMIVLLSSMPFAVAGGPSRLGFLMEVAAVAAAAALDRRLALVLAPPMETGRVPMDLLDVDGALVIEPSAGDPNMAYLLRRGLPVVAIGKPAEEAADAPALPPYVDIHSGHTTRLLLEHLQAQGARKIAMILGSARRNSYVEGQAAYLAFAAAHGQAPLMSLVDEVKGESGGREAALTLLAEHPDIDAFCVPVDAFATGAVAAVLESGRRIPEDVMIATRYDGVRARTCVPPLTAVDLHLDEVAQQAIALLFDHLRGDTSRRRVDGPAAQLVPRLSSARPR
ncbi:MULTISPECIES: LacI family DNA-binding transcriptional regulator [Variovorax]|uniref:LacI family DNA-binding transcriptional regulator n=1 Tax=Variovorax TaxID=34072 RepID=UPI00086D0ED9|nr:MULTISPECIES: LacI family DNA-binding transcriptional regulator [Variovorax]MBN8757473.1 LacI family DNA-binding transcriptional regulator [Variovorax sp.]ODU12459.1 MAG: LacI family transcriptional regulator [Variovorax sp. SCN 67-85]ODV16907.1 MAG: LacI family transcriptional regulator [Variovorax sp. SCN 67-20]OJZ07024.1 MAG: LacI family transcriptional regulator [Variovorax sp. 67-131]UKI09444.1 LacI family DNA-binding transcriptional regulator [Variovorax paradoxus]